MCSRFGGFDPKSIYFVNQPALLCWLVGWKSSLASDVVGCEGHNGITGTDIWCMGYTRALSLFPPISVEGGDTDEREELGFIHIRASQLGTRKCTCSVK